MNIFIVKSGIRFKNPNVGQPTKAIEEHYHGRRIIAEIDGKVQTFRFNKEELPFAADEEDMIAAIQAKLNAQ